MQNNYREQLARRLHAGADGIFLYWKGRVALFALLKAMGVGKGDEVVMPAFTCVVVPNAALYAGAKPVYVDIDPATLNPTLVAVRKAVGPDTKCIIIQNTFGLTSEVQEIVAFAKERGMHTIEDCTHGFGGTYQGRPNGSYCDAAFFSTQWNKPFSTGLGGFALVNDETLKERLTGVNHYLEQPTIKQRLMLDGLIRIKRAVLNDTTYWFLMNLYRGMSKRGLILGSSSNDEIETTAMPGGYFRAACDVQAKHGLQALRSLDALLQLRKDNGQRYNTFMRKHGKFHYPDRVLRDHAFLKYPLFVRDQKRFVEKAVQAKIRLGDWFCSMLHPVEGSLHPWRLDERAFPIAREKARTILNLPTDARDAGRVLEFLEECLQEILDC